MNGPTASEKMGLDSERRELKFGDSFSNKGNSFHTIRYDFKPASIDSTKMATLDVHNGQVTISMPHADGSGVNVFTGPRKQYGKECVLIIDPETGEVVLEKLYHSIQVKKTRQEGASRMSKNQQAVAPPLPSAASDIKKQSGQSSSVIAHPRQESKASTSVQLQFESKQHSKYKIPSGGSSSNPNSMKARKSHQSPTTKSSPSNISPDRLTPPGAGGNAFDTLLSNHMHQQQQSSHQASTMPSLTNFDDLLSMAGPPAGSSIPPGPPTSSSSRAQPSIPQNARKPAPVAGASALSESSSSSSSSFSSSDDDDDTSDDEMEVVPERAPTMPSLPTISSFTNVLPQKPTQQTTQASTLPAYSLSDDLQLSESGSDSD